MRNRLMGSIFTLVTVPAFASVILAQTADQPGEAKAPTTAHKPDLSGVWLRHMPASTRQFFSKQEPSMRPWAEAKYKAAKPTSGPDAVLELSDPVFSCFPPGVPQILFWPYPMEIIQIPGRVIMFFEFNHYVRQIYTDGRGHNQDLPSTWMGDSIGRWEGDTLVVDATGFNDKTSIDRLGHPHSDAMHLVERIRRVDHDTLQDDITIDDPKAFTKPWTGQQIFQLKPGWEIAEYVCEDNVNFLDLHKKAIADPTK
jgi:hypothetical protein